MDSNVPVLAVLDVTVEEIQDGRFATIISGGAFEPLEMCLPLSSSLSPTILRV